MKLGNLRVLVMGRSGYSLIKYRPLMMLLVSESSRPAANNPPTDSTPTESSVTWAGVVDSCKKAPANSRTRAATQTTNPIITNAG